MCDCRAATCATFLIVLAEATASAAVTLDNAQVRWVINDNAATEAFVVKATGQDLSARRAEPFAMLHDGKAWRPARSLNTAGDQWTVKFAGVEQPVRMLVRVEADHVFFELSGPAPPGTRQLVIAQATLKVSRESVGGYWPIARVGGTCVFFAALSPNVRNAYRFGADGATFMAEAVDSTGFDDIRVAVAATPEKEALAVIERLELKYSLPHLTLGGQWFRNSPELRKPYLFTDLTEHNVDRVIAFARRGGFGYVLTFRGNWAVTNGHYAINMRDYPRGEAGLKAVADKLHAAGLKIGIHLLSACISRNDPYVQPTPDERLAVARTFTLTENIDEQATDIPIDASPAGVTKVDSYATAGTDLWIDDEILSYRDYSTAAPYRFTRCVRGRYGTKRAAHKAGAKVRYLHRLYNFFVPDPTTDLVPKIAQRIADVVNTCGVDMIYFDGGEAINIVGRRWRDSHWVQREVARRLKREVLITGSGGNAGFGWHTHMRGVSNDGVYNRTKRYLDEHKVPQRIAVYHRNLAAAEMGWLNVCAWSPAFPPTQPDEWEYFCVKALAYDSPVSLHMHERFFDSNGRAGDCLDIIRRYQQAKATSQFSPQLLGRLRKLGEEWRLTGDEQTGWKFVRTRYGPNHLVESDRPETAEWEVDNPFASQPISLRLRARNALRPLGHEDNIVLVEPDGGFEWEADGTSGAACSAALSSDLTREGQPAFVLTGRASREARGVRAWLRHEFAKRPELTNHRSLAAWVRGDGGGALLDVQLADSGLIQARDHVVKLDFTGWRLVRFVDPDFDAAFDYELFRHKGNLRGFGYDAVRELRLQLAGMPRGATVRAAVGRIEALAELPRPLVNPVLEVNGGALPLPVTLQPDQMLELSPDGAGRVYDRENRLIQTFHVDGGLPEFRSGENELRFRAEGAAPFAYVTPILTGPTLEE